VLQRCEDHGQKGYLRYCIEAALAAEAVLAAANGAEREAAAIALVMACN